MVTVSILGSCRQESIKRYYNVTNFHEETSWPHYTKEMLQIIRYAKNGDIKQEDANYIFRKCILKYGPLNHSAIKQMFDSTDLFVLEIASRLSYEYNGYYLHHIASENAYGNPDIIPKVIIRSMSDSEIVDDIRQLKDELSPKKIAVVTHFHTYDGKRKQLADLIRSTCNDLQIPVFDPSYLAKNHSTDQLFCKEAVLSHYTPYGHDVIAPEYKSFIDKIISS